MAIRAVPGRAIPLSPEEDQQGFATAEGFPEVKGLLGSGYRRTFTHDFAPLGASDPCFTARCVIVDYGADNGDRQSFIVDLSHQTLVPARP